MALWRSTFVGKVLVLLVLAQISHASLAGPALLTLPESGSSNSFIVAIAANYDYLFAVTFNSNSSSQIETLLYQVNSSSLAINNVVSLGSNAGTAQTLVAVDPSGRFLVTVGPSVGSGPQFIVSVFDVDSLDQLCISGLNNFLVSTLPFFQEQYLVFPSSNSAAGFAVFDIAGCAFQSQTPHLSGSGENWQYVFGFADPSGIPNIFYAQMLRDFTSMVLAKVNFSLSSLDVISYVDTSALFSYFAGWSDGESYLGYFNSTPNLVVLDNDLNMVAEYPLDLPADQPQSPYLFASQPYLYITSFGDSSQQETLNQFTWLDNFASIQGQVETPFTYNYVISDQFLFFPDNRADLTIQRYRIS